MVEQFSVHKRFKPFSVSEFSNQKPFEPLELFLVRDGFRLQTVFGLKPFLVYNFAFYYAFHNILSIQFITSISLFKFENNDSTRLPSKTA